MRVVGCLLTVLATAIAQDQIGRPESGASHSFVAEFSNERVDIRLEFSDPPGFTFRFQRADKQRPQIHSTEPVEGRSTYRYRFVRRRDLDEGGDRCVLYEFEQVGRPSYDLYVWTKIQSVSKPNLEYMYIDRIPFCIVQIVNPAGIHPIPLNRKGAPESERFQAAAPLPFKKDGKYGYMDKSGSKVLVEPRFQDANRFAHGRAKVRLDGKTGFIDESGKLVIEPRFGWCTDFGKQGAPELAMVTLDGKEGMIDRDGKMVIEPKFDRIGLQFFEDQIEAVENGLHGLFDRTGKILIETKYESVQPFSEGLAVVGLGGRFGYLDRAGKFVIEPRYERAYPFAEGLAPVRVAGGNWGYIDRSAKMVLPAVHDAASIFSEGLASVARESKARGDDESRLLWGFIDKTGKLVIPYRFDQTGQFADGRCSAMLDDKWGWVDRNGKFVKRDG